MIFQIYTSRDFWVVVFFKVAAFRVLVLGDFRAYGL